MTVVSFSALMSQLESAHTSELRSVKEECSHVMASLSRECAQKVDAMAEEIQSLYERLGEMKETVHKGWTPTQVALSIHANSELAAGVGKRSKSGLPLPSPQGKSSFHKLVLKPGWSREAIWGSDVITLPSTFGTRVTAESSTWSEVHAVEDRVRRFFGIGRGGIMFPHSTFRTCWDLTGLLLIVFDLVTLPFLFAFQPTTGSALKVIQWYSLVFWTLDMAQGPFLGYFRDGEYIDSRAAVAKHYLKTWFLVDVFVVLPEWLAVFLSAGENSPVGAVAGFGKLFKSIRIVRVLRLLRVAKVKEIIGSLYDMCANEFSFVLLHVLQQISLLLILNHFVACAWYAIGKNCQWHGDANWISSVPNEQSDGDMDMMYLYLTSLHWSLAQFTPAPNNIHASNVAERLFSIFVTFGAMAVFSSFVGSITNHINRLRSLNLDIQKQLWLLRRFLCGQGVSENLSKRIQQFVDHKLHNEVGKLNMSEMEVMKHLSTALSDELTYELHAHIVCGHPFLHCLNSLAEVVVHQICQTVVQAQIYARNETVFRAGEQATRMLIVQSGESEYVHAHREPVVLTNAGKYDDCEVARWIAEPVLWTHWRHHGHLVVSPSTVSEFIALHPAAFFEVVSRHPRSWLSAVVYAEQFLLHLNSLEHLGDVVTDPVFYKNANARAHEVASDPWAEEANPEPLAIQCSEQDRVDDGIPIGKTYL